MATKINLSSAATVNITCKRGDTFVLEELRFWSDEAKTVPVDISGHTFAMEVKNGEGEVVIAFTMASGFTISDTNKLAISKPAADMLVEPNPIGQPYDYDLEMTTGAGVVSTIMKGTMAIEQDITNAG